MYYYKSNGLYCVGADQAQRSALTTPIQENPSYEGVTARGEQNDQVCHSENPKDLLLIGLLAYGGKLTQEETCVKLNELPLSQVKN